MLESWIGGFEDYTQGVPSPPIYRKWAAAAAVSGALERRTHVWTSAGTVFPNLYVLLVGRPGVGKSKCIAEVHDLMVATGLFNVAPSSITKAALVDQLQEGMRTKVYSPDEMEQYHTMMIASSEFGVLVPAHDLAFLNTLNDLFDAPRQFSERTRTGEHIQIDNPIITMLAGTQPKYLAEIFPDAAFGMGFTSRINFIYSDEKIYVPLFGEFTTDKKMRDKLRHDMEAIAQLQGSFRFTDKAMQYMDKLHAEGIQPEPSHPKMANYNSRRIMHLIKLAMIHSAAETNTMEITESHVQQAVDMLLESEEAMPEIFKAMQVRDYKDQIDEVYNFILVRYRKTNKPVPEHLVRQFMGRMMPAHLIQYNIDNLLASNYIQNVAPANARREFKPLGKFEDY